MHDDRLYEMTESVFLTATFPGLPWSHPCSSHYITAGFPPSRYSYHPIIQCSLMTAYFYYVKLYKIKTAVQLCVWKTLVLYVFKIHASVLKLEYADGLADRKTQLEDLEFNVELLTPPFLLHILLLIKIMFC